MHWVDDQYTLVYPTAIREITRNISYSEMERLGIKRIIIFECGVHDCTPIYMHFPTKRLTPNSLDFSHQQLFRHATGNVCPNSWCQAAEAASPQLCCSSRAAGNAAFSSDSIRLSHFCPLALIEPFCWHQTKVYLGRVKFADLLTFCQEEKSTNNSHFWRNINPSLPNVSRPLTPLSEWLEPEHAGASWLSK